MEVKHIFCVYKTCKFSKIYPGLFAMTPLNKNYKLHWVILYYNFTAELYSILPKQSNSLAHRTILNKLCLWSTKFLIKSLWFITKNSLILNEINKNRKKDFIVWTAAVWFMTNDVEEYRTSRDKGRCGGQQVKNPSCSVVLKNRG